MILLLLLWGLASSILVAIPGLLLMGLGVGTMLTSSVNIVQSSFPDKDQGEISGLSRSVSNLGSSLGTAIAGSVVVASAVHNFGAAFLTMIVFACIGLIAAILIPSDQVKSGTAGETPETAEQA
jgi:MFS family permease